MPPIIFPVLKQKLLSTKAYINLQVCREVVFNTNTAGCRPSGHRHTVPNAISYSLRCHRFQCPFFMRPGRAGGTRGPAHASQRPGASVCCFGWVHRVSWGCGRPRQNAVRNMIFAVRNMEYYSACSVGGRRYSNAASDGFFRFFIPSGIPQLPPGQTVLGTPSTARPWPGQRVLEPSDSKRPF